ncbi:hypothetical protein IU427_19295 [Nocardia beijingensis]|uniref:hypothetical protein n=1 Tax=Nocardia beijingensis TaxID=95162 RepID=UPI0018961121|nr:hypothetical protein [Nocardia beijingensis]MBF6467311.1 hypothetical protein [Nocardia beijingensis]
MALKNDYDAVEGLVIRTDKVLGDMTVDAGERNTLAKLLSESFQGDAGTENYALQQRVMKLIDEYNQALTDLKAATKVVSGIDGQFRVVDTGQAMRFSQIGL